MANSGEYVTRLGLDVSNALEGSRSFAAGMSGVGKSVDGVTNSLDRMGASAARNLRPVMESVNGASGFERFQASLQGIGSGVKDAVKSLGMYGAAIGAAAYAVDRFFEAGDRFAKVQDAMIGDVDAASKAVEGQVSKFDLMVQKNRLVNETLDIGEQAFRDFTVAAKELSDAKGIPIDQVFQQLGQAIETGAVKSIQDLIPNLQLSNDKMIAQKQLLEYLHQRFGDVTNSAKGAADQIGVAKNTLSDWVREAAKAVNESEWVNKTIQQFIAGFKDFARWGKAAVDGFTAAAEATKYYGARLAGVSKEFLDAEAAGKRVISMSEDMTKALGKAIQSQRDLKLGFLKPEEVAEMALKFGEKVIAGAKSGKDAAEKAQREEEEKRRVAAAEQVRLGKEAVDHQKWIDDIRKQLDDQEEKQAEERRKSDQAELDWRTQMEDRKAELDAQERDRQLAKIRETSAAVAGGPFGMRTLQLQKETEELYKQARAQDELSASDQRALGLRLQSLQMQSQMTEEAKSVTEQFTGAIGDQIQASIAGGDDSSFQKRLNGVLRAIGAEAQAKALMEAATGFALLADPFTSWMAPGHFKAAAAFEGVAILAGLGARGTNSSGGGSGSAGSGGRSVAPSSTVGGGTASGQRGAQQGPTSLTVIVEGDALDVTGLARKVMTGVNALAATGQVPTGVDANGNSTLIVRGG